MRKRFLNLIMILCAILGLCSCAAVRSRYDEARTTLKMVKTVNAAYREGKQQLVGKMRDVPSDTVVVHSPSNP